MCGIAAVINGSREEAEKMGRAQGRRGYNGVGAEVDNIHVWFTHLPITDPMAPSQPYMAGKWVVWMNGFISNYQELAQIFKIRMETNCDTELLAKFIEKFGCDPEKLLVLNGFFAVFAYDAKEKKHYAFTDRYGIKQLYRYYDASTNKIYFASEVKALAAVLPLEISEEGAEDWVYSLGIMNPHTIYEGVTRVECLPFRIPRTIQVSYSDAKERLSFLLSRSLDRNKHKSLADGVFLSGGIDSGILSKKLNPEYCFSMDYQDNNYSEIENIKRNSSGIHLTMICNEKLFRTFRDPAIEALDDLKAGSCYTNYALTELAGRHVTILYSGAGGDEVFNGYTHRYARPIGEVIKRTLVTDDFVPYIHYPEITHKQYDWKFLKSVLVVEDRMAGQFAIETRYPLLDNDFVDFALSLPEAYRENKRILKDISGLDKAVIEGKKRGFSNPYCTNFQWATYALNHKRKYEQQLR
jgi:asparagine synthase (glutamine-hydrolysing)